MSLSQGGNRLCGCTCAGHLPQDRTMASEAITLVGEFSGLLAVLPPCRFTC